MKRIITCLVIAVLLTACQAFSAEVNNVELKRQGDFTEVRIAVDGQVRFTHQTEEPKNGKPHRVIVDLLAATHELGAKNFEQVPNCIVDGIRTSQFSVTPEKIVRVVFDMKSAPIYTIQNDKTSVLVRFTDKTGSKFAAWSTSSWLASQKAAAKKVEAKKAAKQKTVTVAKAEPKKDSKPKAEAKPKTVAVAKAAPKQAPKAEPKKEAAKPKTVTVAKAEPKAVAKPAPKAEPKAEAKPAPKAEPKKYVSGKKSVGHSDSVSNPWFASKPEVVVPRVEKKSAPKDAVKQVEKPKTVTVAKAESKPAPKAEPKKAAKPQTVTVAKAEPKKAEPKKAVKPKTEAKPKTVTVAKAEPKVAAKPAPTAESKKAAKPKVEAKPKTVTVAKTAPKQAPKASAKKASGQAALASKIGKSDTKKADKPAVAAAPKKETVKQRPTSRFRRNPSKLKVKGTMVAEFPKRLVIRYKGHSRRDPFETLINVTKTTDNPIEKKVPNVEGLRLVGVIEAGAGSNRALFEDNVGYGYILKSGDKVKNGYVLRVEPDQVFFQIFEYGWSRTVALTIED